MAGRNYQERLEQVRKYVKANMPNFDYHNFAHAEDVEKAVKNYAFAENLAKHKTFLLRTAALTHDLVHKVDANDNEEKTVQLCNHILPCFGYNRNEIRFVNDQILATKKAKNPRNIYEMIMSDADLDNLGRSCFFERNDLLRKEQGKLDFPDFEWFKQTLDFLENHKYYTKTAQRERNQGLEDNKLKVRRLLTGLGGREYAA